MREITLSTDRHDMFSDAQLDRLLSNQPRAHARPLIDLDACVLGLDLHLKVRPARKGALDLAGRGQEREEEREKAERSELKGARSRHESRSSSAA